MKKILFSILILIPVMLIAGENDNSQYVGIHMGTDYGLKTDEGNTGQKVGYDVGFVIGKELGNQVRAEVEVSYRKGRKRTIYLENSMDELLVKKYESKHSWSYMLNLSYDISQLKISSVVPFIGFGIGVGNNVMELKTKSDLYSESQKRRDNDFAYQGIFGFTSKVSEQLTSRIQYVYHRGQQHTINHSVTMAVVKAF